MKKKTYIYITTLKGFVLIYKVQMNKMKDFVRVVFGLGKPYLGVVFVQLGYAGMAIPSKSALNNGMSQHVFAVYRQLVATLLIAPFALIFGRKGRPKMTYSLMLKIVVLGFLEPVIDQNLYYTGMKFTTATFTIALSNVLPAFAFLMAWAGRLEKVNILERGSQAKILGTIVTVGGAMIMTFINGPILNLPWTKPNNHHSVSNSNIHLITQLKGSLMIATGCLSWSAFIILQAIALRSYSAELSLTTLICLVGAIGDSGVALIIERANPSAWSLHFDSHLLAVVYSGVICTGVTYYIQGIVMQSKGPVFFTAFNPLCMILVAIMSSFILSEIMFLGRIIGAVVIMIGLYLVLWGKNKDQILIKSDFDHKIPHCQQQMIEKNETFKITVQSNEQSVVLDVAK